MYPETGETAVRWLEKTHGQPFTKTVPIGVGATRDFIEEVRAITGVTGTADTSRLRLPWYSKSVDSTYLTGKRVFLFGDATHVKAAARIARLQQPAFGPQHQCAFARPRHFPRGDAARVAVLGLVAAQRRSRFIGESGNLRNDSLFLDSGSRYASRRSSGMTFLYNGDTACFAGMTTLRYFFAGVIPSLFL